MVRVTTDFEWTLLLWGKRAELGIRKQASPIGCATSGESFLSGLQWPVTGRCCSQPHLPPGLKESWEQGRLFRAQEAPKRRRDSQECPLHPDVASERLSTKLIYRAQGTHL